MTAPAPVRAVSPAMSRALEVLTHGPARVSNRTDEARGHVYWQTADRLVDFGLAEHTNRGLVLTELGRRCLTTTGRAAFRRGELT